MVVLRTQLTNEQKLLSLLQAPTLQSKEEWDPEPEIWDDMPEVVPRRGRRRPKPKPRAKPKPKPKPKPQAKVWPMAAALIDANKLPDLAFDMVLRFLY
mmetsp:Transcript_42988/g.134884  ORF Transcript_42988/g.134884 Transcript_42988/m.134884 type:complete len:98 (+) Transcript_42988:210-503(+)